MRDASIININVIMIYIVSYDLVEPGQNYDSLLSKIKEADSWARLGGSSYLIESTKSPKELRDEYKVILDSNDKLYVGRVVAPAAWTGMPKDVSEWILDKLK